MGKNQLTGNQARKLRKILQNVGKAVDSYFASSPGTSDRAFAPKTGLSFSKISRIRRGHDHNPTIASLIQLADGLGVPLASLIEDKRNLQEFYADEAEQDLIHELLDRLQKTHRFKEAVGQILKTLRVCPDAMASQATLADEEEILDVFWAVIEAYLHGEWPTMVEAARKLRGIGSRLYRPSLIWLANTYLAYGMRNKHGEDNLREADSSMADIPENQLGPLQLRILAQIRRRQGKHDEAMSLINRAEAESKDAGPLRPLAMWERLKIFRRKAHILVEHAREVETQEERCQALAEADSYLTKAEEALDALGKVAYVLAKSEQSAVNFYRAEFHAVKGNHDQVAKFAKESVRALLEFGDSERMAFRQARPLLLAAEERARAGEEKEAFYYLALIIAGRGFEYPRIKQLLGQNLRKLSERYVKLIEKTLG